MGWFVLLADQTTGMVDKISVQTSSRFTNVWSQNLRQIWVIFNNLKVVGRGSETQPQVG